MSSNYFCIVYLFGLLGLRLMCLLCELKTTVVGWH